MFARFTKPRLSLNEKKTVPKERDKSDIVRADVQRLLNEMTEASCRMHDSAKAVTTTAQELVNLLKNCSCQHDNTSKQ